MTIDPTALLAELAAIRQDVKTACMVAILDAPGPIADGLLSIGGRLDALMYAIAAPPPVDNGMLAPIRARLDELEKQVEAHGRRLDRHDMRIATVLGDAS